MTVTVVDNASSDGSPEHVEEHFPNVTLIRNQTNLGFAKASNIGMYQSSGRYICLVNSDVVVQEDCLDTLRNYMDENPRIGIIGPKILNSDGTLQPTCRQFPTLWNSFCRATGLDTIFPRSKLFSQQFMTFWTHDRTLQVDYLSGCLVMVRREALNEVGLLDEEFFFYAEDKDWCKRFWDNGWEVVYLPHVEAVHRLYGSSDKRPVKFYIQEVRANLQYWLKHHGRLSQSCFFLLMLLHQLLRITNGIVSYTLRGASRGRISAAFSMPVRDTRAHWLGGGGPFRELCPASRADALVQRRRYRPT